MHTLATLEQRICSLRCCAADHAARYVARMNKSAATEGDFFTLLRVDSYMQVLEDYLAAHTAPCPCSCAKDMPAYSCLTPMQISGIIEKISTLCGCATTCC